MSLFKALKIYRLFTTGQFQEEQKNDKTDKTLVTSNLILIMVSSDVDIYYFILCLKIVTHKLKSFDDVLLFSLKPKYVENNKCGKRENTFEFYLLKAMLKHY